MRLTRLLRLRCHRNSPQHTSHPRGARSGVVDRPPPLDRSTTPPPSKHQMSGHARRLVGVGAVSTVALMVMLLVGAPSASAATTEVLALAASVTDVLNNVRNWIMGILAVLATVFLTIGGVRYVLASGDPGEVEKAKQAFKSAGFGYALAALAPLVVDVLKQIVGA